MGKHHIVLTGLSGSGKSTCGRTLASMMGLSFVDLDERVASVAGLSVDTLFQTYGESHFRKLESDTLHRLLLSKESSVIATGGGALVNASSREKALSNGHVIWLKVSAEEAARRTIGESGRPLLAEGDPVAILKELIDRRTPAYACADIHVETDGRLAESIAAEIKEALT